MPPEDTSSTAGTPPPETHHTPLYLWLARLTWGLVLVILFEFVVTSWGENEVQAAILSAGVFIVLLLAGVIVEVVRRIEAREPLHRFPPTEPISPTNEDSAAEPGMTLKSLDVPEPQS